MSEEIYQEIKDEIFNQYEIYNNKEQLNKIEYGRYKQLSKLKRIIEIKEGGTE